MERSMIEKHVIFAYPPPPRRESVIWQHINLQTKERLVDPQSISLLKGVERTSVHATGV